RAYNPTTKPGLTRVLKKTARAGPIQVE
nr:3B (VPg) [limnipivirus A1]